MKHFLDTKVDQFNRPEFIADDPISIPHRFTAPADIEIAGFFAALLAWGQRRTIIRKAGELMERMDGKPFEFVTRASDSELMALQNFVHRTFKGIDAIDLVLALRELLTDKPSLEHCFLSGVDGAPDLQGFHARMMASGLDQSRARKHISNVSRGSAAKRLNMFLRWMVRSDGALVDFGIWKRISMADLLLPLDLHSGRVARKLGLLQRRQDDYRAVLELTRVLREFDPRDPCRYDYALFGLGAIEGF